jgi:hypothetical protein
LKNQLLAAAIVSLCSSMALAETYQAEAGIAYDRIDLDSPNVSVNALSIGGSMYFQPVDDSKGPRMEAAFLSRASNITAAYLNNDNPLDDSYGFDARFVIPNGITLGANYADTGFDTSYSVALGTYLSDHSEVQVSYTSLDDAELDTLAIAYRSVVPLAGQSSLGYTASIGYVDTPVGDDGYELDADVTYYLDRNFGLGASASFADQGLIDVSSIGAHASYFINPTFFIEGYYKTTDRDGPNEDSLGIGASIRF